MNKAVRILVVDDEKVIRDGCRRVLSGKGYDVLTSENGKKAMEVYRRNWGEIDLVVLDMVMPHMSGGETYDMLKEINPNVRVLLSSGFSIDGEASEILGRGCDAFIQKPFNMKDLSGKIREVMEKE